MTISQVESRQHCSRGKLLGLHAFLRSNEYAQGPLSNALPQLATLAYAPLAIASMRSLLALCSTDCSLLHVINGRPTISIHPGHTHTHKGPARPNRSQPASHPVTDGGCSFVPIDNAPNAYSFIHFIPATFSLTRFLIHPTSLFTHG